MLRLCIYLTNARLSQRCSARISARTRPACFNGTVAGRRQRYGVFRRNACISQDGQKTTALVPLPKSDNQKLYAFTVHCGHDSWKANVGTTHTSLGNSRGSGVWRGGRCRATKFFSAVEGWAPAKVSGKAENMQEQELRIFRWRRNRRLGVRYGPLRCCRPEAAPCGQPLLPAMGQIEPGTRTVQSADPLPKSSTPSLQTLQLQFPDDPSLPQRHRRHTPPWRAERLFLLLAGY